MAIIEASFGFSDFFGFLPGRPVVGLLPWVLELELPPVLALALEPVALAGVGRGWRWRGSGWWRSSRLAALEPVALLALALAGGCGVGRYLGTSPKVSQLQHGIARVPEILSTQGVAHRIRALQEHIITLITSIV